jgi:DNA uptake protein ComE-like DNA-binding protein
MKKMKSHFEFTRGQRNGIFLLLLLILIFQSVYFFVNFSSEDILINQNELDTFQNEIDSLRLVELENRKPKVFPFNPNYITDYKGYTLGMSNLEIDCLLKFRAQDKWVNSAKQFQNVTKVSDSLLNIISPHFKFPDWVTNPKPKTEFVNYNNDSKPYASKIDLNKATSSQLRKVNGVGAKLSERIVKFRDGFKGGFIADVQLQEVYGLTPEVISRIINQFTVKTPRQIIKLKLNTASK